MDERATLLKPLDLLEAIASAPHAPTLAELTTALGQPKPTVHRWLATLEGVGLVGRMPGGRRYELAARSSRLALSILANSSGSALRHEILQRTVATLGESCNLTVLNGTGVTYIDRVESVWPLRITFQAGSRVPLHCSASGKLFLAMMAPAKRERLLSGLTLDRFTDSTLTDRAALGAELAVVRGQQYALDREEYLAGLICIAVPVFQAGARGRTCVAALALQAPVVRLSCEGALEKLPTLRDAAAALSATLEQPEG